MAETAGEVGRLGQIRSIASARLVLQLTGGKSTKATGFFIEYLDRLFLISNWHVLSGRDYRTGQCIDPSGATPRTASFEYFFQDGEQVVMHEAAVPLVSDDDTPLWLQHPTYGQRFDVAAIDITGRVADHKPVCVPTWDRRPPIPLRAGEEVFAVGFPLGLSLTRAVAIWKRGSIATEPAIPIDGLPKFLIDTATREGMSGSPVYVWQEYADPEKKTPMLGLSLHASGYFLIGVYSGRYGTGAGPQEDVESVIFKAQLGVVFSSTHLLDIVANGAVGSYTLAGV